MQKNKYLATFWAVTTTSLYQAHIMGTTDIPRITKIASETENPNSPVGSSINNGTMLGICKRFVLFVPEGGGAFSSMERELKRVNTRYWGGHTSEIIGLFLHEEDARACYTSKALVPFDPRWRPQTIETLRAIGKEHPYCSVSTEFDGRPGCSDVDALCDPKEWQS